MCGVEMWRGGVGAAHRLPALSVAGNSPCVRFHIPLIEPDVRISCFRLSEKVHDVVYGKWRGRLLRRTRPSTLCREALENRLVPDITLCLAHNH